MSILLFLVILLVLILVHEFGHFIVAKKSNIRVDEFGIGFPPRAMILGGKGETKYTLNWLPFGGFVKIFGETPFEESISGPDSKRSFSNKPKWIQALVLSAGVLFNLIFAWFLFVIIFLIGITTVVSDTDLQFTKNPEVIILETLPDSPSRQAGILPQDRIIALGGEPVVPHGGIESVIAYIGSREGQRIHLTLERVDKTLTIEVIPETGLIQNDPTRAAIGVSMGVVGELQYPIHLALFNGGKLTYEMTKTIALAIADLILSAFTLSADLSDVAGPIGIVGIVGDAAESGLVSLLFFTAIISINLAIINILPIPALDGGRLLFLAIEATKGSPIPPRIASALHNFFFVLLILLILLISYNDILRIMSG